MFTIRQDRYVYIPLQYAMYASFKYQRNEKNYSDYMDPEFLGGLVEDCISSPSALYIWDFRNMKNANDRGFGGAFSELILHNCSVILANVEKGSNLQRIIHSDLETVGSFKMIVESEKLNHYILEKQRTGANSYSAQTIDQIHKKYLNRLIEDHCIEKGNQYLVSSGVYSNMQINLKKLFKNVDDFAYIIYLLSNQIPRRGISGLIATSKNGVAFASILGELLKLPVLYFNIGQMFEETYNCSPRIEVGGQYVHVYDMICLGSETKVLHALVNAQGGCVTRSVGCICLPDLEVIRKKNRYSSLNRVWGLLNHKDLNQKYEISLYEGGLS